MIFKPKAINSFDWWESGVYDLVGGRNVPEAPIEGLLYGTLFIIKAWYSFQILILYPGSIIYVRVKAENGSAGKWLKYKSI